MCTVHRRDSWCIAALRLCLCLLLGLLGSRTAQAQKYPPYVWIEGEATGTINVKPNISGWGHTEFLSEGKWLQISIDADKVEKELPAGGAVLTYPFQIAQAGDYEVWNRIGYEFVRSPFEWRVDGGAWSTVKPGRPDHRPDGTRRLERGRLDQNGRRSAAARRAHAGDPAAADEGREGQDRPRSLRLGRALPLAPAPFIPTASSSPMRTTGRAMDREAAQKVFDLPAPTARGGADRAASERAVGDLPQRRADARRGRRADHGLPAAAALDGIAVPGDKMARPELVMAHRVWYRTRVRSPLPLPAAPSTSSFPQNNLNTTVYVNGVYCGFNKNPFARFSIDVTKGVKPGVNEVWVGIKDAYYGYSANPDDPMKLRKRFNLPLSFTHMGFQDLAYPVWNAFQSGMLVTPELVAAGPVYSADVFCKPSVARKELAVDVTVCQPDARRPRQARSCARRSMRTTGQVEKTLSAKPFTLAAGANQVVTVRRAGPTRNSGGPTSPHLYRLRTTITTGRQAGRCLRNRLRVPRVERSRASISNSTASTFHGYHDAHGDGTKEEWLAFHRKTHQAMMRFWGTEWKGLPPEEALAFFDTNGVVVRRQGMLDGEAIGYNAIENDPVLKKRYGSEIKMDLMQNWRDQMVAQVQGERNHPSVMIWSIENEWLYINCINLYGGLMDAFEAEVTQHLRGRAEGRPDPPDHDRRRRREQEPDHAGARQPLCRRARSCSIPRWPTPPIRTAAGADAGSGTRSGRASSAKTTSSRATIRNSRYFGGEAVFTGKTGSLPAAGLMARILNEGYRWADYGALGSLHAAVRRRRQPVQLALAARRALPPVGLDVRLRAEGEAHSRASSTTRTTPIRSTCTWTLTVGGKKIGEQTTEHRVAPGDE